MLGRCLLAGLGGLVCGVVNAAYLLLLLHVISVARGTWRILLSASGLVLAAWPGPVVMFVVMPRVLQRRADEGVCFVLCWVAVAGGVLIWYLCTHPNPLELDWRRGDRGDGESLSPACSVPGSAVVKGEAVKRERVVRYSSLGALGCGVGLALCLLLSRRAFLHYYLAATGCGVGLALYLLLFLRALRLATERRRRALQRLTLPSLMLYIPLWFAFRMVGVRMGLVDDYAAQLGVPFLLGAPALGAAIWYISKYPSLQRTDPTRDGV